MKFSKEQQFLCDILKPYQFKVLLFLSSSLLTSIFDGISIGLLIPVLGYLQGAPKQEELPDILHGMSEMLMLFPQEKQFLIALGCVALAVLIKNVLMGLSFQQGAWLTNRVTADIRSKTVTTVLTVGIGFHQKSKMGELIEKTTNYSQAIKDLIEYAVYFFVFLLMLVVLLFLLMALSWQLTVLVFFLGIFCAFTMSAYMKRLTKLAEKAAKTSRELTGAVQENYSAVRLIQAYSQEQHQIEKLNANIQNDFLAKNKLAFRHFWIQPMTEGLGVISIATLFAIAFFYTPFNRFLTLAVIIPYLYVLIRIVTTLKILSDARAVIKARWPYLKLVYDLIDKENKPFINDGYKQFNGLKDHIRFQALTFSYEHGAKYALNDVNFSITKGKTTAIVGKSGSGKSTIVNLLLRFYDPQQGVVLLDGEPLTEFQLATYRKKIGVVSQDTFIFHDTVKNNIAFGVDRDISNKNIIDAAKKADANDFILQLTDGYDTILGDHGVNLSGGQRQRISIARAILKDPEILILDEATSALDTITERLIHAAIADLSYNRTVIIIAHRLSTIKNADQVIVLKNGRVVESGDPQQLLTQQNEYYNLVQRHE